ncbi:protein artichoke-like [Culicoides brevitarsis]|uniref:protein artichoke-like n=1 Tax=Culicoides brevitarsis TaxID=469753 RepID=UPI00307C9ECE
MDPTSYHWTPAADNPSIIKTVSFVSSVIHVVTNKICNVFGRLENLYLIELGITDVTPDAFRNCSNLKELNLFKNHIKQLHPYIFKNLANLETLILSDNQIEALDAGIFDSLDNLQNLIITQNNLTEFPMALIKFNCHLKSLSLSSNDLRDLEVEKMLEILPNLMKLWWEDNEVLCSRAVSAINYMIFRGISYSGGYNYKERCYQSEVVCGNYKCKPDYVGLKNCKAGNLVHDGAYPVYKCVTYGIFFAECVFTGVKLTAIDFNWTPTADDTSIIGTIKFVSSKIPVVTNNICTTFPKLNFLNMEKLEIQEITENGFHSCRALQFLFLTGNYIKKFHPTSFVNLINLQFLDVGDNLLTEITYYRTFKDLKNLRNLVIYGNNLKSFPAELLKDNPLLSILQIYSNDLLDLEVEQLVKDLPYLSAIWWEDNEVLCSRAIEANNFLRSRGISISNGNSKKVRCYPTEFIFGNYKCRSNYDVPVYKCETSGTVCTFTDVTLTDDSYKWKPTADNPAVIAHVNFSSSVIPVITSDICKTFPNMNILELNNLEITEVAEDAFHNCALLNVLNFESNHIKKFHPNTFMFLKNLRVLNIEQNQLSELNDYKIFSEMPNLSELYVDSNNLMEFSPELVRYNPQLTTLNIYSNDLSDLDVEKLVEFLPNLEFLYWEDNEVSCSRAVKANNFLQSKGITSIGNVDEKVRFYPTEKVFDTFKCNPDISWMASNYRKQNSELKLQISNPPIYKCETTCEDTFCTCKFTGIELTADNFEWTPTDDDPTSITRIEIFASTIPVFTNVLCKTFPNFDYLLMEAIKVQEVTEDAFHDCSSLKELHMGTNLIRKLHPNTFLFSKNLEVLGISRNKIMEFDDKIFSEMTNLQQLSAGVNNLTSFSPELVKHNSKLTRLSLSSNDLSDLNVEQIVEYLPNLKFLDWQANEVSCSRAVDANNFLAAKGISFSGGIADKIRYYPTGTVFNNFVCNPDTSWMASKYKKQNVKNNDFANQILKLKNEIKNVFTTLKKIQETVGKNNATIKEVKQDVIQIEERISKVEGFLDELTVKTCEKKFI